MAGNAEIVVTVVEGGTSNSNTSTNTNTNTSQSVSENRNLSVSTSNDTSNVTSHSTSDATNHNFSESTSTDTSFVTSNTTSNNTTRSYSESTSNDTSKSNVTSNSTSVSTSNSVSFSQSDIEVSLNNILASNYKADQDLEGVRIHELAETDRQNKKLAFAQDKFDFISPLLGGILSGGVGTQTGGSGGSIGFQASLRPMGFMSPQVEADYTAFNDAGMGHYSMRRTSEMWMGSGDVKTGGIGFASGSTVADAVAATRLPYIRTCGVLTPAQVQMSVNAAQAKADTRTQSEIRRVESDLSGRGFSTNSPILAAIRAGLASQNLRATLESQTKIQIEAATTNAQAIFDGQKAVSDQYLQQEQVLLSHEQNENQRSVGVLQAVATMVSSAL